MNKVVVFDLDETIGYFLELGVFWDTFLSYITRDSVPLQEIFNSFLDLYPEFLRPNLFSILKYLKRKKESGICKNVMIYTNNQGPKEWCCLIKNYLNTKLQYPLFDQTIGAFKVNGKVLEVCRTTNDKTKEDFMRCTKLPENTEICFLDDTYYPGMIADNIYYIKMNPYVHNLSFPVMVDRFLSNNYNVNPILFKEFANKHIQKFSYIYIPKSKEEYEIDKIISKKTMILLQEFFQQAWKPKTRRIRPKIINRTKTIRRGVLSY